MAYLLWCFLLWCLQIILILIVPEVADETYYWYWSKHLGLDYLDHPPAVAWVYALGGRWLNAIMWPLSAYWVNQGLFHLKHSDQPRENLFWQLLMLSPFGLVGSVIVTVDTPMIWAWCLCFYAWCRGWIYLLGLGLILGIHSKLLFWLAVPGFLYHWKWSQRLIALGMMAVALLCSSSGLSSSGLSSSGLSSSGLSSIHFQVVHRLQMLHTSPMMAIKSELEWIFGQIFLISPLYLVLSYRYFQREQTQYLGWNQAFAWTQVFGRSVFSMNTRSSDLGPMLWFVALPCLLFCIVMNCWIRVEANWSILFCLPLLVYLTSKQELRFNFFTDTDQIRRFDLSPSLKYIHMISWGLVLLFAFMLDQLPLSVGPVRSPIQLTACIQEISQQTQVKNIGFSRYQELSLFLYARDQLNLDQFKEYHLMYLRPQNRRLSVYDQIGIWDPQHTQIKSPFLLISKPEWLKEIKFIVCQSPKPLGRCSLTVFLCH